MTLAAKLKIAIFALLLAERVGACACTVIVVGPKASADGSAMNSQTADGMFDSNITVVPGRVFPPGAMADVRWNLNGHSPAPSEKLGEIPQVPRSVGSDWDPTSGKPGAVWAARRVPDERVFCMANLSRIREIDLGSPEYFMTCRNYQQTAIDNGWYDPESGKPFIWQEAYTPRKGSWSLRSPFIRNRLYMFHNTVAPSGDWPVDKEIADYPFSIKPEKKLNVQDVMALMRSTFKGTPLDTEADPAWHNSRLATRTNSDQINTADGSGTGIVGSVAVTP